MIKNYDEYKFSMKERFLSIIQGICLVTIVGWIFYKSILAILLLSPLSILYMNRKKQKLIHKRKFQLNMEFRDAIISLQSALNVGYSIERAFEEAIKDLKQIYNESNDIIREFIYMNNLIKMNQTVEEVLRDFANRSKVEDIIDFADVFSIAKRTGGNLIHIIKNTCNSISDKIELQREIRILFASKRYEAKVLKFMPFVMVVYLSFFSPDFLLPLYHNAFGIIVMSILLIIYFFTISWIDKIMKIRI